MLAVILVFTWQTGSLVIRSVDPWVAYGHISADWSELWGEFAVGLVILLASLVLSLFSDRVFCKYVCPLGAFNAILGRIPLFRIKRRTATCTSCHLCTRKCPMAVPVAAGLGIYGLSIGVGHLLGMARFGPASLHEQELGGKLQITDIKGSATWAEIAASFKVDLDELMRDSGIDPALVPPGTRLKETARLAGKADFTPDTARIALAKMLGLAYAGENGDRPETGHEGSQEDSSGARPGEPHGEDSPSSPAGSAKPAAPDQGAALPARTTAARQAEPAGFLVPASFELEGTMSIQDLAAAFGVTSPQVIAKLHLPAGIPVDKPLKELRGAFGFSMPELKARIHE